MITPPMMMMKHSLSGVSGADDEEGVADDEGGMADDERVGWADEGGPVSALKKHHTSEATA